MRVLEIRRWRFRGTAGLFFEPSLIQNTLLSEDLGLHTVGALRNSLLESIIHSEFFIEHVLTIT